MYSYAAVSLILNTFPEQVETSGASKIYALNDLKRDGTYKLSVKFGIRDKILSTNVAESQ